MTELHDIDEEKRERRRSSRRKVERSSTFTIGDLSEAEKEELEKKAQMRERNFSIRSLGDKPTMHNTTDGVFWMKPEDAKGSFKKMKADDKPSFASRKSLKQMFKNKKKKKQSQ